MARPSIKEIAHALLTARRERDALALREEALRAALITEMERTGTNALSVEGEGSCVYVAARQYQTIDGDACAAFFASLHRPVPSKPVNVSASVRVSLDAAKATVRPPPPMPLVPTPFDLQGAPETPAPEPEPSAPTPEPAPSAPPKRVRKNRREHP